MKLEVPVMTEIEPVSIRIRVPVNYGEDDIPNDFPFRTGDVWEVTVDIDTGKIRDWPQGRTGEVHMKVRDEGAYFLEGKDGEPLGTLAGYYVPSCIPGESGDYIAFDIAANGTVKHWKRYCTEENILDSFFSDEL